MDDLIVPSGMSDAQLRRIVATKHRIKGGWRPRPSFAAVHVSRKSLPSLNVSNGLAVGSARYCEEYKGMNVIDVLRSMSSDNEVDSQDILTGRTKKLVPMRYKFFWVCHNILGKSGMWLADYSGHDATTVLYGIKRHAAYMEGNGVIINRPREATEYDKLSFTGVLRKVCGEYGVHTTTVLGSDTDVRTTSARQKIFWVLRRIFGWTYNRIGAKMNRHHTTVHSSLANYERINEIG